MLSQSVQSDSGAHKGDERMFVDGDEGARRHVRVCGGVNGCALHDVVAWRPCQGILGRWTGLSDQPAGGRIVSNG